MSETEISAGGNGAGNLTFVTIVFSGDIQLLRLQAQSMARFVSPGNVSSILLVINDVNEAEIQRKIEAFSYEFGPLAEKVRIVRGDEVLKATGRALPRDLFERVYVDNRYRIPFVRKGGWRGGNGYRMQQALKLASARIATSDRIVILDCKNIFLRDVRPGELFDETGRARAVFLNVGAIYHRNWLKESLDVLSVPAHVDDFQETTGYSTPYPVNRQLLLDVLDEIENTFGSVQKLFASKRRPSEFMLIFAYCVKKYGGVDKFFARYEGKNLSLWADFEKSRIDSILDQTEADTPLTFGLHRNVVKALDKQQFQRMVDLFETRGIQLRSVLGWKAPGAEDA